MATTWNPSDKSANVTLSDGDTKASTSSYGWNSVRANQNRSSGKYYCEIRANLNGGYCMVGLMTAAASLSGYPGQDAYGYGYQNSGYVYAAGGDVPPTVATYGTVDDVIGLAYDADSGALSFYKNNALQKTITSIPAGTELFPVVSVQAGSYGIGCFSAADFLYSPPTGYSAWDSAPAVTTVTVDTIRQLTGAASVAVDTLRRLSGPATISVDLLRRLITSQTADIDTLRQLSAATSVSVDTLRQLIATVSVPADTSRRKTVPFGYAPAASARHAIVTVDTCRRLA